MQTFPTEVLVLFWGSWLMVAIWIPFSLLGMFNKYTERKVNEYLGED